MEKRIGQLCEAIRGYLASRPDAADSAIGIRDWWLGNVGADASVSELQRALDTLVERGELSRSTLAGGVELFAAVRSNGAARRQPPDN